MVGELTNTLYSGHVDTKSERHKAPSSCATAFDDILCSVAPQESFESNPASEVPTEESGDETPLTPCTQTDPSTAPSLQRQQDKAGADQGSDTLIRDKTDSSLNQEIPSSVKTIIPPGDMKSPATDTTTQATNPSPAINPFQAAVAQQASVKPALISQSSDLESLDSPAASEPPLTKDNIPLQSLSVAQETSPDSVPGVIQSSSKQEMELPRININEDEQQPLQSTLMQDLKVTGLKERDITHTPEQTLVAGSQISSKDFSAALMEHPPKVIEQDMSGPTSYNTSQDIDRQMTASIQASLQQGRQHVTIDLNPPELGRVFVRLQQDGDHITGTLQISKQETRVEIERALPQMLEHLQNQGVPLRRIEVMPAPHHSPEGRDPGARQQTWSDSHEGWSDQTGPNHRSQERYDNDTPSDQLQSVTASLESYTEPFTTGYHSINMLI